MGAPIELLRSVPIFQGVDEKHLKRIADTFTERTFTAGQELVVEGSGGVGFFVIESGEARVSVEGEPRRDLGAGNYFGEVALIDGGARTATVTATTDGKMFGITSWQFRPLVEANASIAWPLLEAMAKRTRELDAHQH
jgi:CRP/FNR family transcriptional regulator, cyclic AMP receptor protein